MLGSYPRRIYIMLPGDFHSLGRFSISSALAISCKVFAKGYGAKR
jgi:hypothetical protein